jgi:methylmalonyl-CoA/ethylmalonyl-CoA epimerase
MKQRPLKNRRVVQNAFVVRDMDQAMRQWTDTLGIGPFLVLPPISPDQYLYRGQDIRPQMRVGLAQAGDVQIEFMQMLSDSPSVYRDLFNFGDEGLHHLCIFTDDIDEDLAHHRALGMDVPVIGCNGEVRFAFVDARKTLGCMLEIVTDSPLIKAIYGAVRTASENWDGRDPVRQFKI